jgi:hypothetical protein
MVAAPMRAAVTLVALLACSKASSAPCGIDQFDFSPLTLACVAWEAHAARARARAARVRALRARGTPYAVRTRRQRGRADCLSARAPPRKCTAL